MLFNEDARQREQGNGCVVFLNSYISRIMFFHSKFSKIPLFTMAACTSSQCTLIVVIASHRLSATLMRGMRIWANDV